MTGCCGCSRSVTMKGNALSLEGHAVKVGDKAPDCELLNNDLAPTKLSSYRGKVCVICSVPSLDTPVCEAEIRRFNEEATKLGNDVEVVTVSMDLPFAQKRWCGAAGIDRVTTLSDHRSGSFGTGFGVGLPDLRLLARAVFVLDKEGMVRYEELVSELTEEPNYAAAIEAVKKLT